MLSKNFHSVRKSLPVIYGKIKSIAVLGAKKRPARIFRIVTADRKLWKIDSRQFYLLFIIQFLNLSLFHLLSTYNIQVLFTTRFIAYYTFENKNE